MKIHERLSIIETELRYIKKIMSSMAMIILAQFGITVIPW